MTALSITRSTANSANQHIGDHVDLAQGYNSDSIILGPNKLLALTGTPALAPGVSGSIDIVDRWLLDPATTESVHTVIAFPYDWSTYDVTVLWDGAGTGSPLFVVMRFSIASFTDASLLTGYATVTQATVELDGGGDALNVTTLVEGAAVPAGTLHAVQFARIGGDAADTKGGDLGLAGIILSKAS